MSTNFAKTLVWKHEYDVILWRHKQRTPNTNDYPMPLNETPPWKVSAYATGKQSEDLRYNTYCCVTRYSLETRQSANQQHLQRLSCIKAHFGLYETFGNFLWFIVFFTSMLSLYTHVGNHLACSNHGSSNLFQFWSPPLQYQHLARSLSPENTKKY